jgi:hypothetical protein
MSKVESQQYAARFVRGSDLQGVSDDVAEEMWKRDDGAGDGAMCDS